MTDFEKVALRKLASALALFALAGAVVLLQFVRF